MTTLVTVDQNDGRPPRVIRDNVVPFSPLPLLRESVERQLAQLRAAAEQQFAIADAFQGAADDALTKAGRMQANVERVARELEELS